MCLCCLHSTCSRVLCPLLSYTIISVLKQAYNNVMSVLAVMCYLPSDRGHSGVTNVSRSFLSVHSSLLFLPGIDNSSPSVLEPLYNLYVAISPVTTSQASPLHAYPTVARSLSLQLSSSCENTQGQANSQAWAK